MTTTAALLDDYAATAVAWEEAQRNAAKANRLFDHLHGIYHQLRARPEGQHGIEALLTHPSIGVRLVAATHSLGWSPARARQVLEAIQSGPGLHAVSATYTLKAYKAGTLDLDWSPRDIREH